jgi:hypothetical protein
MKNICIQKVRIFQTYEGKNYTHKILLKSWQEKNNFTPKNYFLYNLQRDKTLSISKKKIRNGGTCNEPNPKKKGPKYIKSKSVEQIGFDKKVFGRRNSIGKNRF